MSTLPQLEHELIRAARRRACRRTRGRRLALVLVGATLTAGGATAATELLKVDEGSHSQGAYVIERLPDRDGKVCLQYRDSTARRATYGCGPSPSDERPIGLVVADYNAVPNKRLLYGLVAPAVDRVNVLGRADEHTDTTAREQPGIPGKYFRVIAPKHRRVEVVAYNSDGEEVARLGSRRPRAHSPRSQEDAMAQGDPSGFAPTAAPVSHFTYRGRPIDPDDAARRQLICVEDEVGVRCYGSQPEMEAAERRSIPTRRR